MSSLIIFDNESIKSIIALSVLSYNYLFANYIVISVLI